jgi:hypothetical protein
MRISARGSDIPTDSATAERNAAMQKGLFSFAPAHIILINKTGQKVHEDDGD